MSKINKRADRVKNKIMFFAKGERIRDRIITEGKVAVYIDRDANGEFIVEENISGVINKIPCDKNYDHGSQYDMEM